MALYVQVTLVLALISFAKWTEKKLYDFAIVQVVQCMTSLYYYNIIIHEHFPTLWCPYELKILTPILNLLFYVFTGQMESQENRP